MAVMATMEMVEIEMVEMETKMVEMRIQMRMVEVKYATYTLLDNALTWWNSHKRTIETYAAYALSWRELLKLMTKV
ncbi:hypothetical protein Tco_0460189, partial [Tanacetum coccineum]